MAKKGKSADIRKIGLTSLVLVFLGMAFTGCVTTGKITNAVIGTSWQTTFGALSAVLSFNEAGTFSVVATGSEEGIPYQDIDESGSGLIPDGKGSTRKIIRLENTLTIFPSATDSMVILEKVTDGEKPDSLAGSKYTGINMGSGVHETYSFLDNDIFVKETVLNLSGTYKYTNANTIILSITDGNIFNAKISADELDGFLNSTWKKQ